MLLLSLIIIVICQTRFPGCFLHLSELPVLSELALGPLYEADLSVIDFTC